MTVLGTAADSGADLLFEEPLHVRGRGWIWLPPILAVTFLAISPIFVPVALGAWFVNVLRFRRAVVRVDHDYVRVGKRAVRLAALDLTTLGRAQNSWPWRPFNRRWLGANPIWTSDSVGVRGFDEGRPYWVSVGTNRREELVAVLEQAVPPAQERLRTWTSATRATTSPPAWHPDPWDPVGTLRWWDGTEWTGWTHPPTSGGPR